MLGSKPITKTRLFTIFFPYTTKMDDPFGSPLNAGITPKRSSKSSSNRERKNSAKESSIFQSALSSDKQKVKSKDYSKSQEKSPNQPLPAHLSKLSGNFKIKNKGSSSNVNGFDQSGSNRPGSSSSRGHLMTKMTDEVMSPNDRSRKRKASSPTTPAQPPKRNSSGQVSRSNSYQQLSPNQTIQSQPLVTSSASSLDFRKQTRIKISSILEKRFNNFKETSSKEMLNEPKNH